MVPFAPPIDDTAVPADNTSTDNTPTDDTTKEVAPLVPDEIEVELLSILKEVEKEDEDVRLRELRLWRRIEEYMMGVFDIYWDEFAKDYRSLSNDAVDNESNTETYRKNVNVMRPHAESIIAALSVKLPGVTYFPDDAEDTEDIDTAKAYSEVTKLIEKHNPCPLLLVRMLMILWNQGTVFAYNYYKTDPKYGTIDLPETKQEEIYNHKVYCTNCGEMIGEVKETKPTEPLKCTNCGYIAVPEIVSEPETINRIVGYTNEPKGRESFDCWGPKNVKVSFWARRQEDIGYLLLKLDTHYAMLKNEFQDMADDINTSYSGGNDTYERYMRLAPNYYGQVPQHINTIKCLWLRPWMYWVVTNVDKRTFLTTTYPNGIYCIFIDDKLAAIEDENLDKHWTISFDPTSEFIHGEPLGKPLIPIQEIENDLNDLSLQTIEYGISENFVNPKVVDFTKYGKEQAAPGMLTPATPLAGQGLGDAFYQTKPAVLSQELGQYYDRIEKKGQFAVGDFPSVFGGPSEGSKTAFEYNKSNSQALQRLSLVWKRVVELWTNMMAKGATEYIENMKTDERTVKKINGKFVNTWIRKEQLTGKIGHIEPETSEQLPQSWEQKSQAIMGLLNLKDPAIEAVLLSPENSEVMKMVLNMPEFYIPGENDRNKQFSEIYDAIAGQQINIDLEIDDHPVHMRIIKNYLTSSQGLDLYTTNPKIYAAIVQHYAEHQQAQVHNTQDATGTSAPGQKPNSNIASTAS